MASPKLYGIPSRRRIQEAVVRVENQPYNFAPARRRAPRLGGGQTVYWCVPSNTVAGGTVPPSGSPGGPLTGQTFYTLNGTTYTALSGTYSLYCPYPAGIASGKLLACVKIGASAFAGLAQSCT